MDFCIYLSQTLVGPFYNREWEPRPLTEFIW